jgi:hypothetical protein
MKELKKQPKSERPKREKVTREEALANEVLSQTQGEIHCRYPKKYESRSSFLTRQTTRSTCAWTLPG